MTRQILSGTLTEIFQHLNDFCVISSMLKLYFRELRNALREVLIKLKTNYF